MSDYLDRISRLSPKRLALLALEQQERLETMEASKRVPIAIVGIGCRLPGGVRDSESYWNLLRDGVDAIREVPLSRWNVNEYYDSDPAAPGKMSTRWGGFIDSEDLFDAKFFGIAPVEAIHMDPQQRLLLEVSWEALENAGIAASTLAGTRTGVFIGICNSDYGQLAMSRPAAEIDPYIASGISHAVAAGRLSYFLGLHGPSLAIDTACSSSLVAVHLACQSLRLGESAIALAGGVNLILNPDVTIALSRSRMMAADGRCKTFDDSADGFVRGEGCGVVVLKRLPDAIRDGDRILALIRGSAVNQDGRSSGITAPNGPAQEAVIRAALVDGGVCAEDVSYVEAHGTGTSLGDPIEIGALGATLAVGTRKLIVGSGKTNIGHLESAAGVAGLIKLVLTLRHGQIPASLHFETPNRRVDWEHLAIEIPTRLQPWKSEGKKRIGGVSSFGFSGTNAHIVLEEIEPMERQQGRSPLAQVVTLSARTELQLRTSVGNLHKFLAINEGIQLDEIARTLNAGRTHFGSRLALVAESTAQLRNSMASHLSGKMDPNTYLSRSSTRPARAGFLFTGQGSEYAGMGRELYESGGVFSASLKRCEELLRDQLDEPLLTVLFGGGGPRWKEARFVQPMLFSLEYALSEQWRNWGIEPSVVMGHSLGEYVAACVAGVFSLEDALMLVANRGRLMDELNVRDGRRGGMLAVSTNIERVSEELVGLEALVSVAAENGTESVVLSGEREALLNVGEQLRSAGIRVKELQVTHAFHSPLLDPMLDGFRSIAAKVSYQVPQIAIVSNLLGRTIEDSTLSNANYWVRHTREMVQFRAGLKSLADEHYTAFLELGPQPTLSILGARAGYDPDARWISTLNRNSPDRLQFMKSIAELDVAGFSLDWNHINPSEGCSKVTLPSYPFNGERYWLPERGPSQKKSQPRGEISNHPLLGERLDTAVITFEACVGPTIPLSLQDHRVDESILLPAAAFLDMALSAARELGWPHRRVSNLRIIAPLLLKQDGLTRLQSIYHPDKAKSLKGEAFYDFEVYSKQNEKASWILNATGQLSSVPNTVASLESKSSPLIKGKLIEVPTDVVSGEDYYGMLEEVGVRFGPAFRGVQQIEIAFDQAIGRIKAWKQEPPAKAMTVCEPSLLDACFQVVGGAALRREDRRLRLLHSIEAFTLYAPLEEVMESSVLLQPGLGAGGEIIGSVEIRNIQKQLIARAVGVKLVPIKIEEANKSSASDTSKWFYQLNWQSEPDVRLGAEKRVTEGGTPEVVVDAIALRPPVDSLVSYSDLFTALNRVCSEYILGVLESSTAAMLSTDGITPGQLEAALEVHPKRRKLFEHLISIVVADGFIARDDKALYRRAKSAQAPPVVLLDSLVGKYPEFGAELSLLRRCGDELKEVLQGKVDPVRLLFPNGSMAEAERIYRDSPIAKSFNLSVRDAVLAVVDAAGGREIRILEIGAGTGSTTASLISALRNRNVRYKFTDLSAAFLSHAREQFSDSNFIEYAVLDIERDPIEQGFEPDTYDVVIAANVLHATSNLRRSIAYARALLAPGGIVLMLEGTVPNRWIDLTFGLTDGWWRFEDLDLRPTYPLISVDLWIQVLQEAGFTNCRALGYSLGTDSVTDQKLIVARRSPENHKGWLKQTHWIVMADRTGVGVEVDSLIREGGGKSTLILAEDMASVERVLALGENVGLIYLCPLDQGDEVGGFAELQDRVRDISKSSLELLQLIANRKMGETHLWLVTRGAQLSGIEMTTGGALQSMVWGFGRVLALEFPGRLKAIMDIDPVASAVDAAKSVLSALAAADGEDQVLYRNGVRSVARLQRIASPKPTHVRFSDNATYLITGGLGGLGIEVAEWASLNGAKHIALLGRSVSKPLAGDVEAQRRNAIEEIEATGAQIYLLRADVASESEMDAVFAKFGTELPPLKGIFHAAADVSVAEIVDLTPSMLESMLRPKVVGTWNLHRLTTDLDLDFFVAFSSSTSILGSKAMAHYAAANQFMDSFASYRHSVGLPMLSVNWGTWATMRGVTDEGRAALERGGMVAMPAEKALGALEAFMNGTSVQVMIADIRWSALKPLYESRRRRPFLDELGESSLPLLEEREFTLERESLQSLLQLDLGARLAFLRQRVQVESAKVMGLREEEVPAEDVPLMDLGLDSLMAMDLRNRLQAIIGQELPSTIVFDHPTIRGMAQELDTRLWAAQSILPEVDGVEQEEFRI